MALLLLRAVLGIAIIVQGAPYIGAPDATVASWIFGLAAAASSCLLLIGFLTPVAGVVVGLAGLGISVTGGPSTTAEVFDSRAAIIFGLTILLAIIGAGPGRYSVDARVFGRREIVVPLPHSPLQR